jgi:hypothetical protein
MLSGPLLGGLEPRRRARPRKGGQDGDSDGLLCLKLGHRLPRPHSAGRGGRRGGRARIGVRGEVAIARRHLRACLRQLRECSRAPQARRMPQCLLNRSGDHDRGRRPATHAPVVNREKRGTERSRPAPPPPVPRGRRRRPPPVLQTAGCGVPRAGRRQAAKAERCCGSATSTLVVIGCAGACASGRKAIVRRNARIDLPAGTRPFGKASASADWVLVVTSTGHNFSLHPGVRPAPASRRGRF